MEAQDGVVHFKGAGSWASSRRDVVVQVLRGAGIDRSHRDPELGLSGVVTRQGEKVGLFSKKKTTQTYTPEVEPAPQITAPARPVMPTFDDPDDVTRWEALHSANSLLAAMMEKYQECFEKADMTERAYAMGNAEFVDGIRQHEISRKHFHDMGVRSESELEGLLAELRAETLAAREQWQNLLFLLPPGSADNDIMKIADWATSHGVDSEVMSSLLSNSMFINCDFGTSRQSFWQQNDRIVAIMNQAGE